MKCIPLIAATATLLSLAINPAAFAAQACTSLNGHFEASLIPPGQGHCPDVPTAFCTAGRVWGGIQGDYEFVMSGATPSATIGGTATALFYAGQSDIKLKNGDHVFGTDTGSLDPPPGLGGFASLITFTGGTGSMAGASGQISLRGEFDAISATTSGDYSGNLCSN